MYGLLGGNVHLALAQLAVVNPVLDSSLTAVETNIFQ